MFAVLMFFSKLTPLTFPVACHSQSLVPSLPIPKKHPSGFLPDQSPAPLQGRTHQLFQWWPCHNHILLAQWLQTEIRLRWLSIRHSPWSTFNKHIHGLSMYLPNCNLRCWHFLWLVTSKANSPAIPSKTKTPTIFYQILLRERLINFFNGDLVTIATLWVTGFKKGSTSADLPFSTTLETPLTNRKYILCHFLTKGWMKWAQVL